MASSKAPKVDRSAAEAMFAKQREEMLAKMRAAGLASRVAEFEPLIRDTIALEVAPRPKGKAKVPVGASRLGGLPDFPAAVKWPEAEGEPLSFVGQISVADVAPFDIHEQLPSSGLLSFFAGDPLDDNGTPVPRAAALFFDKAAALEPATPPEPPSWWEWGRGKKPPVPQGIAFGARAMFPTEGQRSLCEDTEYQVFREDYYDLANGATHHGMLCFDHTEWDQADNEHILLRLDEDDIPYSFFWSTFKRLYVVIDKDALKKQDFSSVRMVQGIAV